MTLALHCLATNVDDALRFDSALVCDSAMPLATLSRLHAIWLPHQSAARARALLERGARRVLLGDAALADRAGVAQLAADFGGDRVGLYVRARRMANQWSFETSSNADFKTVTPSVCEPTWEVLRSDGTAGARSAHRWIASMDAMGLRSALVEVDIDDDADLNLCAGLVELMGERVCFAPATQAAPALHDWVQYGQARAIALPPRVYARRRALLAPPTDRESG